MSKFNWKDNKEPLKNQIHEKAMCTGIGIMNTELLSLIDEMANHLVLDDKKKQIAKDEMRIIFDRNKFESTTFGKQVREFSNNNMNKDFNFDRLYKIIEDRNYFIHKYRADCEKNHDESSKRLYNLIHSIINAKNAVIHIKSKTEKDLKRINAQNNRINSRNDTIQKINHAIIDAQDPDGWTNVTKLSFLMNERKIDYKSLSEKCKRPVAVLKELKLYDIVYENKLAYVKIKR